MKVYNKPEFYTEEFIASVAVTSCNWQDTGKTEEKYTPQPITCQRRDETTDYIFSDGMTGCKFAPNAYGYLEVKDTTGIEGDESFTFNTSQISDALGYTIKDEGNSVKVWDPGAWYVIWGSGNHYGPATVDVMKIFTSSY